MVSDAYIGIDLGTTNCAVAYVDAYGSPEMIKFEQDERTVPSAVYFAPDGTTAVGETAKQASVFDSELVATFFKRRMGESIPALVTDTAEYDAEQLSTILLRMLADGARTQLGVQDLHAVITVPAYFHNSHREATIRAGQAAGLDVLCTINEPTAAAQAYGRLHPESRGTMLVYDLGGGTFDVTLLRYEADSVQVLGSSGDHELGGKDWDDELLRNVAARFQEAHGIDLLDEPIALADLRQKCEQAKRGLSIREQVRIPIDAGTVRDSVIVTRAEFEGWTEHLLDRTRQLIVEVFHDTGIRWGDVAGTILVGGSTRMPGVKALITQLSRKAPLVDLNPDECVAQGAALEAHARSQIVGSDAAAEGAQNAPAGGLRLRSVSDVMPHALGYVQVSADETRYINGVVVQKNTPVPANCVRPCAVTTSPAGASELEVIVLQGNAQRVLDNEVVGSYLVQGVPSYGGETVVEIGFGYDRSGVVQVSASDSRSGQPLQVTQGPWPADLSWTDGDPADAMGGSGFAGPVFLVLDTSGSMSGSKLTEAKAAAIGFLDTVDMSRTSVGLAEFGNTTGVVLPPTNDKSVMSAAIQSLSIGGSTPMGESLASVERALEGVGSGVVVVLSDGAPDSSARALEVANRLKGAGVTIFAVGVTGADHAFMRRLASDSDKSFESSLDELAGTFRRIGTEIVSAGAMRDIR